MIQEKTSIKGEYKFINLSPKIQKEKLETEVLPRLRKCLRLNKGLNELRKEGIIKNMKSRTNIVPTVGRNVLTRLLVGDSTYSGEVNYGALGTGDTAFNLGSTQLNTEVYRKLVASHEHDGNIAWVDWFIDAGDLADGTYDEFGAFIDGTASANTGQAWSLLLTGGFVKSGSLFISAKYDFLQ